MDHNAVDIIDARSFSRRGHIFASTLLLLAFAVYGMTLGNGFVYDDVSVVVNNPWINDIGNLPEIFARDAWGHQDGPLASHHYRPLLYLLFMIVHAVSGDAAWGFHAVSILLHASATLLVFFIARRLFETSTPVSLNQVPAAVAAALFAVHPVQAEAVSWISAQTELSFTLFSLLAWYFHLRSGGQRSSEQWLSAFFFTLAVLSKETAVVVPLVLVVSDYALGKNDLTSLRTRVRTYLPYALIIAAYLIVRVTVLGGLAPRNVHQNLSTYQLLISVFPLFARYLSMLALPAGLNAFHDIQPAQSLLDPVMLGSIAATAFFLYAALWAHRRNAIQFIGLTLIAVPLFPALYIPGLGEAFFAERYLYLPSVGFVLCVTEAGTRFSDRGFLSKRTLGAGMLLVIALYSWISASRSLVWRDDLRLFTDTVLKSPRAALPRNNLGNAYAASGRTEEAIREYRMAAALNPYAVEPHRNLGFAYMATGRMKEAIAEYRIVLWLAPYHREAQQYLRYLLNEDGKALSADGRHP